jgi:hypothetical protein
MLNIKYKFNKIRDIFALLIIIMFISSCGTTKEVKKELPPSQYVSKDTFEVIKFKKNIQSLSCSGNINFSSLNENMKGSFEMEMIRNKVLAMDIFGPFGISVARIFATRDSLILYNLWAGKYYQTNGAIDGFEFISPFVSKLFNLIIAEPFNEVDSLLMEIPLKDSLAFSYKINEKEFYRFIFKRKYESMTYLSYNFNENKYEVYFRNFEKYENFSLPNQIDIYDQTSKNQLKITIEEIKQINAINQIQNSQKNKFKKVNKIEELF